MALFSIDDLNGKHYLGLQEGETLQQHNSNVYYFPHNFPSAKAPQEDVDLDVRQATEFMTVNYHALRNLMADKINVFNERDAAIISLHRLLAAKHGLVSPNFAPNDFYVDYTEAVQLDEAGTKELSDRVEFRDLITDAQRRDVFSTFVDRVSLVAFVFRSRGHHYMDTFDDLYSRVWQKSRFNLSQVHLSFHNLATAAFHAIFPKILDDFWQEEIARGHVNGALAKRFDCAVAGMAGPHVLRQGITDILMVAPGLEARFQDAILHLDEVMNKLSQNRFAGSVNCRYYGAPRVKFDEKRLSAIAAIIEAALNALTEDSPLAKSPALRRIAQNAPITGAVLGKAISVLPQRPEVINNLLVAPMEG